MSLDNVRRAVLIDMAYEIGGAGLAEFVNFLAAIRAGAWLAATVQLKNSKLFAQVPRRENENIDILMTGVFPAGVYCAQDLIKRHEGLTLIAKPDAKGKWEAGYGHDIPPPADGEDLVFTENEAEAWFATDYPLAEERAAADLGAAYW